MDLKIEKSKSLKEYNAFKLDVKASEFLELNSVNDLDELINYIKSDKYKNGVNNKIVIGDATNLLFLDDFNGLVIKNSIKGIESGKKDSKYSYFKVYSGEVWDKFVDFAVNKNFGGGIENLVSIPGRVGSAIVQNIGAYGVEIKDLLVSVEAYSFESDEIVSFAKNELEFDYRNSFFKKNNGKYFIISAVFKLEKNPKNFILDYGNIKNNINQNIELTPLFVSNTIRQIRDSKLPDYKILGNCGSFFKNPIVDSELFNLLKTKYKNIPSYKIDDKLVKIPAAWLIETAGFKGAKQGGAAVYENHSLIIVNNNNASPNDIKTLSDNIINKVYQDFNIRLKPEVIFV